MLQKSRLWREAIAVRSMNNRLTQARRGLSLSLGLGMTVLLGCTTATPEVRSHKAKPGDALVVVDDITIEMTHPFKPGEPNGLFDGGVRVKSSTGNKQIIEINAICSMPNLPDWPQYDNIYGRRLAEGEQPGIDGGATDWQLLIHFDAEPENKGRETAPRWAQRLADNLCRKGDFRDN